ncbi:MAG TPA: hypothetical protein VN213_08940 [Solirubrobacteraceae bacterium]|nr:hypothetical protein [Solirubrobacteraceae bacterium]
MTLLQPMRAIHGSLRRPLTRLVPMALVVIGFVVVALPSAAIANRACGMAYNDIGPYGVDIERGGVTCATARRALRRYFASDGPCGGSSCRRTLRGWTCQTAPAFALPRIASCQRGRSLVEAIAILD